MIERGLGVLGLTRRTALQAAAIGAMVACPLTAYALSAHPRPMPPSPPERSLAGRQATLSTTGATAAPTFPSERGQTPAGCDIQHAVELRIGSGGDAQVIASTPEAEHESNLSRAETTSAVHYVRFVFTPEQVAAFADQPVTLAVVHPEYPDGLPGTPLGDATRAELLTDLTGG